MIKINLVSSIINHDIDKMKEHFKEMHHTTVQQHIHLDVHFYKFKYFHKHFIM